MNCPICNAEMVMRKKKGTDQKFWGCSKFPNCKGLVNIEQNPVATASPGSALEKKKLDLMPYAVELTKKTQAETPDTILMDFKQILLGLHIIIDDIEKEDVPF